MKKTQGLVALLMLVFGTTVYAAEGETEAAANPTTTEVASTENTASSAGIGEQAQAPATTNEVSAEAPAVTAEAPVDAVASEEPKAEESQTPKKKKKKSRKSRKSRKSSCTANSCYKSWPSHMEEILCRQNGFRSVQDSCRAVAGQVCTTKTVPVEPVDSCGSANSCNTSACAN